MGQTGEELGTETLLCQKGSNGTGGDLWGETRCKAQGITHNPTLLNAHQLYCLHTWLADEDIRQAIQSSLSGDILQVPPMYSALKVKGQKLYNLARDGQTIERCVWVLRWASVKGGSMRGGWLSQSQGAEAV